MTADELKAVLVLHRKWLYGQEGGKRADLTRAVLRDADLTDAVLTRADLRRADLTGAVLTDAVLRDADLTDAVLRGADLRGADLRGADLTDAVLRGAVGKPPVEPMPDIRAKVLAAVERDGSRLDMSQWHTCETTHCLAGWITTLHPQGKLLEHYLSPSTAAAWILHASGETIPDFYDTDEGADERAMNWLRTGVQADPVPAGAA